MEEYVKPVMMLEEVEDEVYTDTATGTANIVTETAIVSGDVNKTPYQQPSLVGQTSNLRPNG